MSAEMLAAAIEKLEGQRGAAFAGPWEAVHSGVANGDHSYVVAADSAIAFISANDGDDEAFRAPTAELIVTLHRGIDPQLALLREEALRLESGFRWINTWSFSVSEYPGDGTRASFEIDDETARSHGLQPGLGRYDEAVLNEAGIRTRLPLSPNALILDLARAILEGAS
ncbi:hypothetical protein [Leifsonia aquatica]|uniref:hypothetical protein n=1 Tax=Leifsonia aquatica TaxID=144185 RepID=UPI0038165228